MRFLALAAILAAGSPAAAATLEVSGGQLVGAAGVSIAGSTYDVDFVEGTCIGLFDGCNAPGDFTFASESTALVAAQALLDQVFLDGGLGPFDTEPELTFGCTATNRCNAIIPFTGDGSTMTVIRSRNQPGTDSVAVASGFTNASQSTASSTRRTYAVFTEVSTVPLPAAGWALLAGLGALVAVSRRKRA